MRAALGKSVDGRSRSTSGTWTDMEEKRPCLPLHSMFVSFREAPGLAKMTVWRRGLQAEGGVSVPQSSRVKERGITGHCFMFIFMMLPVKQVSRP